MTDLPLDTFSVSVQGSTGALVGSHGTQINHYAAPVPSPHEVPAPPGVHNLPLPSAVFVGRDLVVLDQLFGRGRSGQVAIHGLGGIGKTELAIHYAHAHFDRHSLVWWITADKPDTLGQGLCRLASRLLASAALAHGQEWAIGWLQAHPGWLLVLDDVEEIADIQPLLGQLAGRGSVLVTTRRDPDVGGWAPLGLAPLRLEPLDRNASIDLLMRLTRNHDHAGADALAADLGDLPLALEQAAAYIARYRGMDFHSYRNLLVNRFDKVSRHGGRGGNTERTISQVWQVTMDRITGQSPLAREVLDVMAWLGPDELPEDVLFPLADEPDEVLDAVALLADYNMIKWQDHTVSVHRLVQAATRQTHSDPTRVDTGPAFRAVHLLNLAKPAGPPGTAVADWPRWNRLLPHIDALFAAVPAGRRHPDLLDLADRTASYRRGQGQFAPAIAMLEEVLADRRRALGDEHQVTLSSRNNLALAYVEARRGAEAVTLLEKILADRRLLQDNDDVDVLANRHNLALAYREVGRIDDAITLHKEVFFDLRRVLGEEHRAVLTSRHCLAIAYRMAGRVDEAITLHEEVLADVERVLGRDDPATLKTRHHLAAAFRSAGRFDEAITLHEAVHADAQRLLGDNHPSTLSARHSLALAYQDVGRVAEAVGMLETVLADYRRVLGDDHADTREVRESLARIRDADTSPGRPADGAGARPQPPRCGAPQ